MNKIHNLQSKKDLADFRMDIMTITPEMAREWLKVNIEDNRGLKASKVAGLVNDITTGRYQMNGMPIQFNRLGQLCNGQHRLTACVQAGESIISVVQWGISDEAVLTIDQGISPRTGADMIRMRHGEIRNRANVHQIANMAIRSDRDDDPVGTQIVTASESNEYIAANLSALEQAASQGVKIRVLAPIAVGGYAAFCFNRLNPTMCDLFFDALHGGESLHRGQPIYELRRRLINGGELRRGQKGRRMILALLFKAWNYEREGRNALQTVKWEPNRETFPHPK